MLEALSGKTHSVLTGVFVGTAAPPRSGDIFTFEERVAELADTAVTFKSLSREEITWYLATEEWREAAGAFPGAESLKFAAQSFGPGGTPPA